jgi:transposase InsO family protein
MLEVPSFMPWKQNSSQTEREKFIAAVRDRVESFKALCQRFEISRKTGYKWLRRARQEGSKNLRDRQRGPGRRDPGGLRAKQEAIILKHKKKHPYWGSKKIFALLSWHLDEQEIPSRSTVHRVLARAGLVKGVKRRRYGPTLTVTGWSEAEACNEVWGVDFKGWFKTGDRAKCYPLTVTDYYSRFIVCLDPLASESLDLVRKRFAKTFRKYGKPKAIRVDNGHPFGGGSVLGLTQLSVEWRLAGIDVQFMDPGKPYQNGRHERMHLTYKQELCQQPAPNLRSQRSRSLRWTKTFNYKRPHEALKMRCPGEVYVKSPVSYVKPGKTFRYPGWEKRKVQHKGDIWWSNRRCFLSEAFRGYEVGLKPMGAGVYEVYLADILLGTLHDAAICEFRPTVEVRKSQLTSPKKVSP